MQIFIYIFAAMLAMMSSAAACVCKAPEGFVTYKRHVTNAANTLMVDSVPVQLIDNSTFDDTPNMLSTPWKTGDPSYCPHCMSCTATEHGIFVISYKVHIGEFWLGSCCCANLFWRLENAGRAVSLWSCHADGNGEQGNLGTTLTFNMIRGFGSKLSDALNDAYPEVVKRTGGFNCPNH